MQRLRTQCEKLKIGFLGQDEFEDAFEQTDVVLDAIFGFSFSGDVRDPFREAIDLLKNDSVVEFEFRRKRPPIVSVDLPSSWDVEQGNINNSNSHMRSSCLGTGSS